MLGIGGLSGTAIVLVLNGGLDIQTAADTEHPLFIHIQLVVMGQIILDPAVSFVRILCMDPFHNLGKLLVFQLSGTLLSTEPAVIGRSGHAKYSTGHFDRIILFFLCFFYCQIEVGLPHLAQRSLLSISSNFFSR